MQSVVTNDKGIAQYTLLVFCRWIIYFFTWEWKRWHPLKQPYFHNYSNLLAQFLIGGYEIYECMGFLKSGLLTYYRYHIKGIIKQSYVSDCVDKMSLQNKIDMLHIILNSSLLQLS